MRVIEAFWRDVRFAWRSLQRSPGFTMCACLVLSIAVGATTALFTLLDRNILRALPYPDPDRLVVIHETLPVSITPQNAVNAAHFEAWRAAHSFERIALILPVSITLSGPTEPELVGGACVSSSLFGMLGASVVHGRTFLEHEDELGRDRVAVLGYDLWTRRYGADSAIVGQHVRLDGEPYTVIGVLGPQFEPPSLARLYPFTVTTDRPEIWTPLGLRPSERVPTQGFMFACIAQLKPQVSVAQARAEMAAVQGEIGRGLPGSIDLRANVVTLHEQLTTASRAPLQLLFATAIAVLLVACVNIANLLVVRGVARQREFAIMQAVGAAPRRVLRQVLAETVTLAGASGVLGTVLASILLRWIFVSAPVDLPRIEGTEVDGRVLIFVVMTSGATALVLGLVPAWRSSIVAPMDALRSGTPGAGRGWETRVRSLLLGLEVGASATCLLVAGLLVASLINVLNVDSGFAKDRVVSGELRLPATRYNLDRATRFLRALKDAAASVPGVISVGISDRVPLSGEGGNHPIALEGTSLPRLQRPIASLQLSDGGYFGTLGIPVLEGRVFDEADRQRPPVAVVAAAAAARLWPGQSAIGKRFRIGADSSARIEVIGVVGDVRGVRLESSARPSIYVPYWHAFVGQASITLRTAGDSITSVQAIRRALRQLDPEMAAPVFESIDRIISRSVTARRFQVHVALALALAALVLASLGVYGTVSYAVGRQTREIAVRIAVGATPAQVRRVVIAQAITPVGIGVVGGFLLVIALAPLLRSLLFGVSPLDPRVFAITATVLTSVALLAGYVPSGRATRVDPIIAMRSE